jgi:GH25 family lysozyme M1 (1,4-beta-N-acetylmuramidase)
VSGTIGGADISHYQGAIDWAAYAAANQFVIIKATEGVGHVDPNFAANRAGAHAAGLGFVGLYHFAAPGIDSASDEARHFLATVGPLQPGEKLFLDIEVNKAGLNAQQLGMWAATFMTIINAATAAMQGIYSYGPFLDHMDLTTVRPLALLWIAGYTANEPEARGWARATFWQYTDKADVAGIAHPCDRSVFFSDQLADLAALTATVVPPASPDRSPIHMEDQMFYVIGAEGVPALYAFWPSLGDKGMKSPYAAEADYEQAIAGAGFAGHQKLERVAIEAIPLISTGQAGL